MAGIRRSLIYRYPDVRVPSVAQSTTSSNETSCCHFSAIGRVVKRVVAVNVSKLMKRLVKTRVNVNHTKCPNGVVPLNRTYVIARRAEMIFSARSSALTLYVRSVNALLIVATLSHRIPSAKSSTRNRNTSSIKAPLETTSSQRTTRGALDFDFFKPQTSRRNYRQSVIGQSDNQCVKLRQNVFFVYLDILCNRDRS
jgi:hypothetical protein